VLAASLHRVDDFDVEEDDEPIILDDEPAPKRARKAKDDEVVDAHAEPMAPAPLEIRAADRRPSLLPAALAASGVAHGAPQAMPIRARTIDPF
jgi:hypothetical protein